MALPNLIALLLLSGTVFASPATIASMANSPIQP